MTTRRRFLQAVGAAAVAGAAGCQDSASPVKLTAVSHKYDLIVLYDLRDIVARSWARQEIDPETGKITGPVDAEFMLISPLGYGYTEGDTLAPNQIRVGGESYHRPTDTITVDGLDPADGPWTAQAWHVQENYGLLDRLLHGGRNEVHLGEFAFDIVPTL